METAGSGPIPDVTVIVPSYNSARTIHLCLEALLAQVTTRKYDIIVVDSSSDTTPGLLAAYEPRVTVVLSAARLFPGPARNLGIEWARGGIIAFTDTDCIVAPDWIERILEAHAVEDAVGGRVLNGTPGSFFGTALYMIEFVEFAAHRRRRFPSIPTCNISYKRGVFSKYGTFPDVSWGEEYILNTRIPDQILFRPEVMVRHVNRTGFLATTRHAYKVGHGAAQSRRATGQVKFLFSFRVLIPLLLVYRYLKIGREAARSGQFGAFLLTTPAVILCLAAWTAGFFRGAGPAARGNLHLPVAVRGDSDSHP